MATSTQQLEQTRTSTSTTKTKTAQLRTMTSKYELTQTRQARKEHRAGNELYYHCKSPKYVQEDCLHKNFREQAQAFARDQATSNLKTETPTRLLIQPMVSGEQVKEQPFWR